MTLEEKLKVAEETISTLEKRDLERDDHEAKILLASEKKDLTILQLKAKIEVYCDLVDSLIKELKGE